MYENLEGLFNVKRLIRGDKFVWNWKYHGFTLGKIFQCKESIVSY